MGNCAASRLAGAGLGLGCSDSDDPVALCRDRKRLIKAAVLHRRELSTAHADYVDSLHSVATALDMFVLRHSAPAPILITLPNAEEKKVEALTFDGNEEEESEKVKGVRKEERGEKVKDVEMKEEEEEEMGCGYFFDEREVTVPPPPEVNGFDNGFEGWDFFNPFYGVQNGVTQTGSDEEEELRVVREKEGIPELEEAEPEPLKPQTEKKATTFEQEETDKNADVSTLSKEHDYTGEVMQNEEKGMEVCESNGRELLEALRDVCDLFMRAYDSGKDLSRMLEVSRKEPQSGFEEVKESHSKIFQAITWHHNSHHRSSSSLSCSSYRSQSTTFTDRDSKTESTIILTKTESTNNEGGMRSGTHSNTLERLYAWEKKLYDEVKAGDKTRQSYEKKSLSLHNKAASNSNSTDKTRNSVRDLYSRILVALRAVESISEKIQRLRDEELEPQIVELLQGFARTWKTMLESHETQKQIIFAVNSFTCPAYGKFSNDAQRNATLKLEAEIRNWRSCFKTYLSSQKSYFQTLNDWLSKFVSPSMVHYYKTKNGGIGGVPPLVIICNEWVSGLNKLPDRPVSGSIRNFIRSVRVLWVKQGEEQTQKRKVDGIAKEIDKKVYAFKRAENKVLETKLLEKNPEIDAKERIEYLAERKEVLNNCRKRLESEKTKHIDYVRETHDVTLNGFKIGFASIFESLTDFSKESLSLYESLMRNKERMEFENIEMNKEGFEGLDLNAS